MGIKLEAQLLENKVGFGSWTVKIWAGRQNWSNETLSPEYTVAIGEEASVLFQIMFIETSSYYGHHYVKLKKQQKDEHLYVIKYHCKGTIGFVEKSLTADDGTWRLVERNITFNTNNYGNSCIEYNVSIKSEKALNPKTLNHFCTLHDDTELTDIELRGVDGSVSMHKAIAASFSPVLRRMFAGTWKETAEGVVDVPDTTRATLQHLKDYMYLGSIPDTGLEQLLLLASLYIIPDLEMLCVNKLKTDVTPDKAYDLILFAARNNMSKLLFAILYRVQNRSLSVADIEASTENNEINIANLFVSNVS